MKRVALLFALIITAATLHAQGPNFGPVNYAGSTPSGPCTLPNFLTISNAVGGGVYQCYGSPPTWHITSGSGTFVTLSGDAVSTSTGGATEVVGLLNHLLPSLTTGYLNWTGTAWALSSGATWPAGGAGIPNYNGSNAWGTSYSASNTIPIGFLPSLTLTNIGAGAAGSGLYDFSGVTQSKLPSRAGFTAAASGEIGYDTTNGNMHMNVSSTDLIMLGLNASGASTNDCAKLVLIGAWWEVQSAGAACGSGGGGSPSVGAQYAVQMAGAVSGQFADSGCTAVASMPFTCPNGFAVPATTYPAYSSLTAGSTGANLPTALSANSAGWLGPITGGTSWVGQLPGIITAGLLHFAAPGSAYGVNVSVVTSSLVAIADMSATGTPSSSTYLRGDNTWATLAVANTYRTCDIPINDTSGSAITTGQMGPQSRVCFIPAAATIVEMDVNADAGTPNIIVGRNHAGTIANIVSSALATAASGGIACSNTGGTTSLNGATTCSSTLQNISLSAGDYLELVSGTPGGTAKFFVVHVTYTVN